MVFFRPSLRVAVYPADVFRLTIYRYQRIKMLERCDDEIAFCVERYSVAVRPIRIAGIPPDSPIWLEGVIMKQIGIKMFESIPLLDHFSVRIKLDDLVAQVFRCGGEFRDRCFAHRSITLSSGWNR